MTSKTILTHISQFWHYEAFCNKCHKQMIAGKTSMWRGKVYRHYSCSCGNTMLLKMVDTKEGK